MYVNLLLEGAVLKGYNPENILKEEAIPVELLADSRLRLTTKTFARLSQRIAHLLADEAFGMLEKPMKTGSFALMAKASLSSRNIEESLHSWANTFNLLDVGYQCFTRFDQQQGLLAIQCRQAEGIKHHYLTEVSLTYAHRFQCWLANEFLPIEKVELSHSQPAHAEEYRYVYYGAPVSFNCQHNAIYLSRTSLDHPCSRSRDELDQMLENFHERLFTQPRHSHSIAIKVRLWMESLFRNGEGSAHITAAAAHTGLTEQTLRRRLRADGTSYKTLKAEVQRDIAIHYIEQNLESIETLAFRLGFSEASALSRAFKQWTGLTPLGYRKLQQRQPVGITT
jgi:AraC-like DNA-binding protein